MSIFPARSQRQVYRGETDVRVIKYATYKGGGKKESLSGKMYNRDGKHQKWRLQLLEALGARTIKLPIDFKDSLCTRHFMLCQSLHLLLYAILTAAL